MTEPIAPHDGTARTAPATLGARIALLEALVPGDPLPSWCDITHRPTRALLARHASGPFLAQHPGAARGSHLFSDLMAETWVWPHLAQNPRWTEAQMVSLLAYWIAHVRGDVEHPAYAACVLLEHTVDGFPRAVTHAVTDQLMQAFDAPLLAVAMGLEWSDWPDSLWERLLRHKDVQRADLVERHPAFQTPDGLERMVRNLRGFGCLGEGTSDRWRAARFPERPWRAALVGAGVCGVGTLGAVAPYCEEAELAAYVEAFVTRHSPFLLYQVVTHPGFTRFLATQGPVVAAFLKHGNADTRLAVVTGLAAGAPPAATPAADAPTAMANRPEARRA